MQQKLNFFQSFSNVMLFMETHRWPRQHFVNLPKQLPKLLRLSAICHFCCTRRHLAC